MTCASKQAVIIMSVSRDIYLWRLGSDLKFMLFVVPKHEDQIRGTLQRHYFSLQM